jgi:hypothetical protein
VDSSGAIALTGYSMYGDLANFPTVRALQPRRTTQSAFVTKLVLRSALPAPPPVMPARLPTAIEFVTIQPGEFLMGCSGGAGSCGGGSSGPKQGSPMIGFRVARDRIAGR